MQQKLIKFWNSFNRNKILGQIGLIFIWNIPLKVFFVDDEI